MQPKLHEPEAQTGKPFWGGGWHDAPQAPQFGSLVGSTQLFPHLSKPVVQVKPHCPLEQYGCPPGGAPHTVPQVPQFCRSELVATHWPLQFVVPVGQLTVQLPFEQTWPVAQALPHAPQLLLSVLSFTHALPHSVSPAGQVRTQLPVTHDTEPPLGAVHALPQAPQFWASLEVLTQAPLHLVKLVEHVTSQAPAVQAG